MTHDLRPPRSSARGKPAGRGRRQVLDGDVPGERASAARSGLVPPRADPAGPGGAGPGGAGQGNAGQGGAEPDAAAAGWGKQAHLTGAAGRGIPALAVLFVLSLLPQISFKIGPLLMKPYRVVLLILFLPLLVRLFSGAAGRVTAIDWLMIASVIWAALTLMVNHPIGETVEPIGVIVLELLGAYLIARVCVRSAEDFRRVVKVLFWIILFLLPFALVESVTRRSILLQLLGQNFAIVDTGLRWGLRRAQAVFAHPIHYGVFVSAGLGLVWYALRPGADLIRRALFASIIALSTFLSLSAGALLAFMIQCGFIAWEIVTAPNPYRWRLFIWCSVFGYLVLDLIARKSPFHTLVHYATFSTSSGYNRILIWRYGTDNVLANPVFGLGLNDWERPRWMISSVDNFWLLLTMQHGLPFIAMLLGALYLIVRRISRQPMTDPVDRACRAGYLTTLGGIVIAGGTVHYWQAMFAFVLFIIGTGLWMISGGVKQTPSRPPGPPGEGDVPRGGHPGRRRPLWRRKRPIL